MRFSRLISASTALILGAAAVAFAGGEGDHDAMMMEWMQKYGVPGEEHAYFEFFVGEWSYENTSYMGPEPTTTEGMANYDLIMGGRFLTASLSGEHEGTSFEGMSLTGFDRTTGECFNYWIDNHGTGVMESRGVISPDGKSDHLAGSQTIPGWGPSTWRMVNEISGDDTFTFSMYMSSMGQPESLMMQIKYTRAKAS